MHTLTTNFDTPNAVIVSFPSYAGGKFIMNCLSLSKDACPQDSESLLHLLVNPEDYEYRLNKVLQTLPADNDLENWRSYEFGDLGLYGRAFFSWRSKADTKSPVPDYISELSRSRLKFFLTDHSGPPVTNKFLQVWPNATVIRLINSRQFQTLSVKLKKNDYNILENNGNYSEEKYNQIRGHDWPSWSTFEQNCYRAQGSELIQSEIDSIYQWNTITNTVITFDVDGSIFDQSTFLTNLENLYTQLKLTDFNPALCAKFYQAYMKLHLKE